MSLQGHGPTPQEMAILHLWEQRRSPKEISAEVRRPLKYVQGVISNLACPVPGEWEPAARHGSTLLLEALRRHHPERCGAAS